MSDSEVTEVPDGWTTTRLDQIGTWSTGGTPSRKNPEYFGDGIPWVKSGDLSDGVVARTEEAITQQGLDSSAAKLLPAGSLMIALYGATIGKLGILAMEAATNQACAGCQVNLNITDPWFVFHYLHSQRQELINSGQGGAQPNLTNAIVREWPIPLPPLAEQLRIVERVEGLLARVQAARQRLARVPQLLKRFRQAILTAACNGQLTAEWGQTEVESPACHLVERLRAQHPKQKKARPDVAAFEDSTLHEVPNRWTWATLSEIGQPGRPVIYGIIKPGPDTPSGIPYVRVTEMKDGTIDVTSLRRAAKSVADRFQRATLQTDDILISKDGTIGRVAIVPASLEGGNITQHLVRASVANPMSVRYVALAIQSPAMQKWLTQEKLGVALQGVNVEDFRRLPLPIPPATEQHEIVRRVDALFQLTDTIERRVVAATAKADKLTQAILAKAFRGELVPTEADLARTEGRDYETAEQLLERVRSAASSSTIHNARASSKRSRKQSVPDA